MSRRVRGVLAALMACASGVGLAVAVGSAGADTPHAATTTTLGSTTGTPNQNICLAGFNCTYVPFSSAANPGLTVPFDGTVTSFSVNSGSSTGAVELRVLRPAGNGKFTGAGTSPAETLAGGPQTFMVSLPVKAGDVLGLDNSTSALLFDGATANPAFTAYYNSLSTSPGLPDGSTAAPDNNRTDRRLLLSATVVSSGTTTSTTSTTTTGANGTVTVTRTITRTVPGRPVIGNPTQSSTAWSPSVGTTFAFGLGGPARVTFAFRQRVGNRKVLRGTLSFSGRPGTNRRRFKGRLAGGKKLKPGRYTVAITATNAAGTSRPVSLSFTILG